jgi:hypothetical protein
MKYWNRLVRKDEYCVFFILPKVFHFTKGIYPIIAAFPSRVGATKDNVNEPFSTESICKLVGAPGTYYPIFFDTFGGTIAPPDLTRCNARFVVRVSLVKNDVISPFALNDPMATPLVRRLRATSDASRLPIHFLFSGTGFES